MRSLIVSLVVLIGAASAVLPGCTSPPAPKFVEEVPVASDTWVEIDAQPDWVTAPPQRDGTRRFVEQGKSNLRRLAASPGRPLASSFLKQNVTNALAPMIGDEPAAATAENVLDRLVLLQRACKEEILTKRTVPGNTLCTAWALWELPLDDAVSTVPESHRAAARELLATMDLTSRPE